MRRVGEAPFVPQPDVEFVLFIVLASDEPAVIGAVTQTLSDIGIETHLATPEGGPGVLLDYEKAHYVPIALGGKLPPSDRVESTEGEPRWRAKPGLKALLFPNSPVAGMPNSCTLSSIPGEGGSYNSSSRLNTWASRTSCRLRACDERE